MVANCYNWLTSNMFRPCSAIISLCLMMVPLELFIDINLLATLCPSVDSASDRNEYQKCFLGGKDGRCLGLTTLPPSNTVNAAISCKGSSRMLY